MGGEQKSTLATQNIDTFGIEGVFIGATPSDDSPLDGGG